MSEQIEPIGTISRISIKNHRVTIRLKGGKKLVIRGRDNVDCSIKLTVGGQGKTQAAKLTSMIGKDIELIRIERDIAQTTVGSQTLIGGVERLAINHPESDDFLGFTFAVVTTLEVASEAPTLIEILES